MTVFERFLRFLTRAPAVAGAEVVTNEALYRSGLREALWPEMGAAVMKMQQLLAALPDETEGIDIGIHPDPDQDGTFTVMAHVFGPDLYVLNKAVAPYRELVAVRFTAASPVPPVPIAEHPRSQIHIRRPSETTVPDPLSTTTHPSLWAMRMHAWARWS